MKFSDCIGQLKIREQLIKSVLENRVSHAQLFLGPEGCGNLAMALAYAQYINCESRTADDSCGTCPSCTKAQKFIHPDIHFTFPFVNIDKRDLCADWMTEWRAFLNGNAYGNYNDWITQIEAENKQGNINAKECMDIMRKLTLKTFESTYKILILWLPEFLGNEGNRLLKIVEEPPENTVFLFVANDQERIINTILSRLQMVKFPRLSEKDIGHGLVDSLQLDEAQARKIAGMSEGNFNEALALAARHEDENTVFLREWMECCYRRNVKNLFAWNEKFVKPGREFQKNFFQYCLHFYREILLIETGVHGLSHLTEAEWKMAEGLGKILGRERIIRIIELLDRSIFFIGRNVNAKILINYVSITMMKQFNGAVEINKKPFFVHWEI